MTHHPATPPARILPHQPPSEDPDVRGYEELLKHIRHRFGITLVPVVHGRHVRFETCLETGHSVWISEYAGNITPLHDRIALERRGIAVGWHVAIHSADSNPLIWLSSVTHETATAQLLPEILETALRALPRNEQHHIDRQGTRRITTGIEDWNEPALNPLSHT